MKLSPHHHSGRFLAHHHTSYAGLAIVVALVGFVLVFATSNTLAVENPQAGYVGLNGTVPGPAPTKGATILVPTAGQHFSDLPITVSGTCPKGLIVQIFKNDIFAGSTICTDEGGYSLQIDLFSGSNVLVAKDFDALDQHGPDSAPVSVTYTQANQLGNFINQVTDPLFVRSDAIVRGVSPNIGFKWSYEIVGGRAPYAVSLDWGDGKTDLISQESPGAAASSHTYSHPGNYKLIIKVTDSTGGRAYLAATVIVNGTIFKSSRQDTGSALTAAWPLYIAALAIVLSFWLGEIFNAWRTRRREALAQQSL